MRRSLFNANTFDIRASAINVGPTAAIDPGLAAPVVSASLEVVNLSGTVIGSHTVSTSELTELPSSSEPRTSWTYVPTDDGTGGWRLTWDTTRGPQLPATLAEYRELVDGQLWEEPNMMDSRLLPEEELEALEGDPGVALDTVNLRADAQRATYEALAAGGYSAWDDGVTFPPSRFDGSTAGHAGGIPELCPDINPEPPEGSGGASEGSGEGG
ncbi:MAG: hypothetical protein H6698_07895 [Myxococcales bacterium]|nr:hypothetical protein [Myxococcales bacterium]